MAAPHLVDLVSKCLVFNQGNAADDEANNDVFFVLASTVAVLARTWCKFVMQPPVGACGTSTALSGNLSFLAFF